MSPIDLRRDKRSKFGEFGHTFVLSGPTSAAPVFHGAVKVAKTLLVGYAACRKFSRSRPIRGMSIRHRWVTTTRTPKVRANPALPPLERRRPPPCCSRQLIRDTPPPKNGCVGSAFDNLPFFGTCHVQVKRTVLPYSSLRNTPDQSGSYAKPASLHSSAAFFPSGSSGYATHGWNTIYPYSESSLPPLNDGESG